MPGLCKKTVRSTAVALLALIVPGAALATDVYIDITRKRSEHIKAAVPAYLFKNPAGRFEDGKAQGKAAKEAMEFDLQFSGYFGVLKDDAVMAEIAAKEAASKKTEWSLWNQAGVNFLVEGTFGAGPAGAMVVENSLYDVQRSEQIAGIRYSGTPELFRRMVHKFADQVVYRFTGEPGIADTRLVFASKVEKGKELYASDYDGQNIKPLTMIKSIILSPRWSPSAGEILFTSYHNRIPASFLLELRTGSVRPVLKGSTQTNSAAAWSPDGKRIAFGMSTRGIFSVYTISTDGTGLKRLTDSEAIDTSPTWSPDGKSIAFVSDRSGKPQLYIMDADGANQRRFTYNGDYNADPVWSPKGDKIAYAAMTGDTFNIMVKSLDGSIEKQLTANAGKNESPSWSPDGRHIAFSSTRTGTRQIFIMNANGENQVQVTNMPNGAYGVSWSPRQ